MKISIQGGGVVDRFGFEKGYAMLREAGFEATDWDLDYILEFPQIQKGNYRGTLYEQPMETILEHLAPQLALQKKNGITVTQAHAPFPAYLPNDPELLDYMLMVYDKFIRICEAAGCKHLVIHGINYLPNVPEDTPEKIDALNWKLYTSLIPTLLETNVTVCLENLYVGLPSPRGTGYVPGHCCDPVKTAQLIDDLNREAGKECFGLCLDTGHLNLMRLDPDYYISTLGKRIKVLHVHDNNGLTDQHLAPYNGNIKWKRYLSALRNAGYEGDLSFETFTQIHYIDEDELIPSQLQAINAIGQVFRKRLTE